MNPNLQLFGEQIADYLSGVWAAECNLETISQIPGGASRETYRINLKRDGNPCGVVLRRDPPSSLIDTERAHEYKTYQAVFKSGVMPVPEPIVLEEDPGALERPFSIMALVPTGSPSPAALDEVAMQAAKPTLAQNKWSLLGKLASHSATELGVDEFMDTPTHPAQRELAYWTGVIRDDALHPQPIAEAAIRWLERNMPAPTSHLCLVHGDYRTGNYLYTEEGEITAILDWEMAHIGDPLEDLAWSLDPLWSGPDPRMAGRLIRREAALKIWEDSSGLIVDRTAFRWWQIFASVKALAIWISSAEDYVNGTTKEPILALAGWPMMDRQSRILLDRLSPESTNSYAEPLL